MKILFNQKIDTKLFRAKRKPAAFLAAWDSQTQVETKEFPNIHQRERTSCI
jgi:hypothetical protein